MEISGGIYELGLGKAVVFTPFGGNESSNYFLYILSAFSYSFLYWSLNFFSHSWSAVSVGGRPFSIL